MSEVPTILVCEDDEAVRCGVVDTLSFAGYEVIEARDGREAMDKALNASYRLMLLDLVMPHHSGFEVLQSLKKHRPGQAVIILSARGEEADRVKGLTMGADDYVVKPFSVRELLARVDAVLRRTVERPAEKGKVRCATGQLDFARMQMALATGEVVSLSERECDLLKYLSANNERAISREELLRHVWGIDPKNLHTRTVDMHIANLREKLGDKDQAVIVTVRGKGYMMILCDES